jgi:hypothetical protein
MSYLSNLFTSKDPKMTLLDTQVAQVQALPIPQDQKDSLIEELIIADQNSRTVAPAPAAEESIAEYATRFKVPVAYTHIFTSKAAVDKYVADVALTAPAVVQQVAANSTRENVNLGVDNFTRDLTGQAHVDNAGVDRAKIVARIGPDLDEALVNKPDPARDAKYGPLWQGPVLPGASKIIDLVADRQAATWDTVNDKPTESIQDSITYARYNSKATNGNYLFDTLYSSNDPSVADNAAPGEPGYRVVDPGTPGYTGPYLTRSR